MCFWAVVHVVFFSNHFSNISKESVFRRYVIELTSQ